MPAFGQLRPFNYSLIPILLRTSTKSGRTNKGPTTQPRALLTSAMKIVVGRR
jgi:hypothetical protein